MCAFLLSYGLFNILAKYGLNTYISFSFFFGYIGHLIQDTYTKMGIAWLSPLSNHKFSLRKKRSSEKPLGDVIITLLVLFISIQIIEMLEGIFSGNIFI